MAMNQNETWVDLVKFLTKDLGMTSFSKGRVHEIYRKKLKEHVVLVIIKINSNVDGPVLTTQLTTKDGNIKENIWWHSLPYNSGYTINSLDDFNRVIFVRTIINKSIEFYDAWRNLADL